MLNREFSLRNGSQRQDSAVISPFSSLDIHLITYDKPHSREQLEIQQSEN
jgi:hypothetical protein